jgi:hypothetical protein
VAEPFHFSTARRVTQAVYSTLVEKSKMEILAEKIKEVAKTSLCNGIAGSGCIA